MEVYIEQESIIEIIMHSTQNDVLLYQRQKAQ